MATRVTIVLQDETLAFVDRESAKGGKANRSGFINSMLERERRRTLAVELEAAYRRDAADPDQVEEVRAWDAVAGDGVEA